MQQQYGLNQVGVSISEKMAGPAEQRMTGALLVSPSHLVPSPGQPRRTYDPVEEMEFMEDIAKRGILQPLLVCFLDENDDGTFYQIVAGERRWRAAKTLGLANVPVIVKEFKTLEDRMLASLVENIQRANLTFEDEVYYFQDLQNRFNYSQAQIAELIHKSPAYVSQRLKVSRETPASRSGYPVEALGQTMSNLAANAREAAERVTAYLVIDSAAFHNPLQNEEMCNTSQSYRFSFSHKGTVKLIDRIKAGGIEAGEREALSQELGELEARIEKIKEALAG